MSNIVYSVIWFCVVIGFGKWFFKGSAAFTADSKVKSITTFKLGGHTEVWLIVNKKANNKINITVARVRPLKNESAGE